MRVRVRFSATVAALTLAIGVAPIHVALSSDPAEGHVSPSSKVVRWAGSFATAANLGSAATGEQSCIDPATNKPYDPPQTAGPNACDVFTLSVDLPRGFWAPPRTGGVTVLLDGFGSNDDVDLAIHRRNPDGTVGPFVVGAAHGAGVAEQATMTEADPGGYYVFAIGFTVVQGTYRGTATLTAATGPVSGLGRAFQPTPASRALYGVQAPDANPARQRHIVKAADGIDLYVETWLPKAKAGNVPPAKIPTILVMTPYVSQGVEEYSDAIAFFVSRGYALAQHHVRGTGESGGCLEQTGPRQIDDGARVVEYLGRDAPWSNGNVGMYGISYDAETQVSVAGLGDPSKTKYLKAIIPASSVGGQYEYSYMDGVPYLGQALLSNTSYLTSTVPGQTTTPQQILLEKPSCQPGTFEASADQSGDMTPFWQERELRPGAPHVRAATLMVHGLADFNVLPLTEAGFFERLPATTPHKGLFGIWEHAFPDSHSVRGEWDRTDWFSMTLAWYDRYLKGLRTGVESWPPVQVQGNDGQWRAEPTWPTTGGPVGQLALGPEGTLGVTAPTGVSSYVEQLTPVGVEGVLGGAVFESGPLPGRLEITGQPVLDLWLSLDRPDAHLVALLETFDPAGKAIEEGLDYGMRSARHLDPLVDNRCAQTQGKAPPTNTPIEVSIRFLPTDLVVPKGGRVRLTLSGQLNGGRDTAAAPPVHVGGDTPSLSPTTVTILHDCAHPSALRFLTARANPDLLRVMDVRPAMPPTAAKLPPPNANAAGLVERRVCGRLPVRLANFGPAVAYSPPAVAAKSTAPRPGPPRTKVLGTKTLPATGVDGAPSAAVVLVALAAILSRSLRSRRRRAVASIR